MNNLPPAPDGIGVPSPDLIDPLVEPVFVVNRAGLIVQANRAALAALGEPAVRVLGRSLADFAADAPEALDDLLRLAAGSTSPHTSPLHLRHADRPASAFRVYGSLLRSSLVAGERLLFLRCAPHGGNGNSVQILTEQLTELKRRLHEQYKRRIQVEAARQTAEEASRSKSRFLAHMSHELRTPLHAILGFAEVIERELLGASGVPAYATYARYISESGRLLLSIINDMLDLSKIEAGRLDLHIETITASDILERVSHLVKGFAHNIGVRFQTHCDSDAITFQADPQLAIQMLVNLLTNAIKFTPKGGAVSARVWADGDGRVHVTVSDTGIGMSAQEIAKALEPFGQIDSALSRQFRGTGLGLPLTKSLIELHGGTMTIDSTPGQGTNVTLSFPADPPSGSGAPPAQIP